MKRIIATTTLALAISTGLPATWSYADSHSAMMKTYQQEQKGDFYAADFIGKEIYTSEVEWDENYVARSGWEKDWNNIGQVENVILNQDGKVKAVILEVGGFLDIGDKHVAVQMDQLSFIRSEDAWDNYFLAVRTTKDQLMAEPAFQPAASEQRAEMNKPVGTKTAMGPRKDADGREMLRQPGPVAREGYREAKAEELTTETLTGARVYGSKDEDVGEVGKLIIDDSGKITKAVLDIGGFLGMGEHEIGVTMDELRIVRTEDGDDLRVYIDATEEELKAQPEHKDG